MPPLVDATIHFWQTSTPWSPAGQVPESEATRFVFLFVAYTLHFYKLMEQILEYGNNCKVTINESSKNLFDQFTVSIVLELTQWVKDYN